MAPSLGPQDEGAGYWSPRTSTIDWCEHNYEVSWYVAEFNNTVSNLAMILPALYGALMSYRRSLETRFVVLHLLFLVVGLGSTVFHMTLKHSMQLLDEVPMIWGSCYMLYCMHMIQEKPGAVNKTVATFLTIYCVAFVAVYLIVPNPLIFQTLYGLVVGVMVVQAVVQVRLQYSAQVLSLYTASVLFYLAGFILWNLDNHQCPTLVSMRAHLPPLLQPLLQFHAWWHILAGYATYLNIQHCLHHRLTYLQKQVVISTDWCGVSVREADRRDREQNNNVNKISKE